MVYCLRRADGSSVKFNGNRLVTVGEDRTTVEVWQDGMIKDLLAVVRLGPGDSIHKE